jgi:hypothetical protein
MLDGEKKGDEVCRDGVAKQLGVSCVNERMGGGVMTPNVRRGHIAF